MYIYKLTNKKNGKIYIGQSCRNPEVRWEDHVRSSLSTDPKQRKYLHNAINEHGWHNFKPEVIEVIDVKKGQKYLDEREVYHILENLSFHKWGKGYNLTLGGSGTKGSNSCKSEREKQTSEQTDTYDYANYNKETGELVNIHTNVREAAKSVGGLSYEWVSRAADWLIGKSKYATKTYKGFIWMKLPNGSQFPKKINVKVLDNIQTPNQIKKQPRSKEVTSEKQNYEISQYDFKGILQKTWPNNLRLIEREFKTFFPNDKITYNSIINNLKGKNFSAGGYFWKRFLLGGSPQTIPVMSEYIGYEFKKELMIGEPILMINKQGEVESEFQSIYEIPSNIASSFDKIEIYKSATETKKPYKDHSWIFLKDF